MKTLTAIILTAASAALTSSALAQSIWTGNGDGATWASAANWQGGVPGANNDATITSGTPTIPNAVAVRNLTITGGVLTINGSLTVNGVAVLDGTNSMVGSGGLVISPSGSVTLPAGTFKQVDVNLTNNGTIELFNGSVLTVNGAFQQGSSGLLRAHIDGVALSQIGRLAVAMQADMNGTVRAIYDGGFAPDNCILTYTILTSQQLNPAPGLVRVAPASAPITADIRIRPASLRLDPRNIADVAQLGGAVGPDGQVTADDVIVFLSEFFAQNLAVADMASLGGAAGADGQLTADDVILFLSSLLSGACSN